MAELNRIKKERESERQQQVTVVLNCKIYFFFTFLKKRSKFIQRKLNEKPAKKK